MTLHRAIATNILRSTLLHSVVFSATLGAGLSTFIPVLAQAEVVPPQVHELYRKGKDIKHRYGGLPNPKGYYTWVEEPPRLTNGREDVLQIKRNREVVEGDARELGSIISRLRGLPGGGDYATALERGSDPQSIRNAREANESRVRNTSPVRPAQPAPQPMQDPALEEMRRSMRKFDASLAALSNFKSPTENSGFPLTSPPWLTSTWHPILRPPSINPVIMETYDPLQRSAIYSGMLSDFARISAPSIPMYASFKNADPYRVQMELAVVFATYVVPFKTLLGFPRWEGSQDLRESVRQTLTAGGNADVWEQANMEWLAPTGKAMYEAMAAHPREVATLLIAYSHGFGKALPVGGVAALTQARETLHRADFRAVQFISNYGPILLKAMYAPEVRAHYPFPWFIDGMTGTPARTYAQLGPALVRGANELVQGLNGFLRKEQTGIAPLKGGKCEVLFIPN